MTEGGKTPDEELRYQALPLHGLDSARSGLHARSLLDEGAVAGRVAGGADPVGRAHAGDLVEYQFDVADGAAVRLDQALGTLEAFKAVAEIRAVAAGRSSAVNPVLAVNLDAISQDCYGDGCLRDPLHTRAGHVRCRRLSPGAG